MDNFKFAQLQPFSLAGAGVVIGDTSITLKSFAGIDGTLLTMSDFGSIGYGTLEPGNGTLEEQISFTGISQNVNGSATLTGVSNVLFIFPYTKTSGLLKTHAGSTTFIISNTSGFYDELVSKTDDATITATYTFTNPNYPRMDTATPPPTDDEQLATKKYVDDTASFGAPMATDTVFGITKLSVAAVSPSDPIAVGTNDTRIPTAGQAAALPGNNTDIAVGSGNKYVTQTGLQHNAEKYAVDNSSSSTDYTIALSPIPTSLTDGMVVYAKIVNANTTTTPTLNVNSLTAHTIVKGSGIALVVGDIGANQLCTFIYDLSNTRWILQSPVNPTSVNSFISAYTTNTASSETKNTDTTFTTNFLAKAITIYFHLDGWSSAQASTNGVMVCDGTTIRVVSTYQTNTTTSTSVVSSIGTTAPFAGANVGSDSKVTLSVLSVDATTIVVRAAFTWGGGTARTATANYTVVATN